jgi:hypothetical protein
VSFTGGGVEYSGTIVTLTRFQRDLGFNVGEETFRQKRVTPDTYAGKIKYRDSTGRQWWQDITLQVRGTACSRTAGCGSPLGRTSDPIIGQAAKRPS